MAMILCHSPKGGAGATFLASHLAMGLAGLEGSDGIDGDVTLLTLCPSDLTPLHFGLPPAQRLPPLHAPAEAAVLVSGISLRCEPHAPSDPAFLSTLDDAGFLSQGSERTLVIDVPAGERALARSLMPHAQVHVCPLTASPDCLALLPRALEESEDWGAQRSAYVIGKLDETRRLARHVAAFMREVLGERLTAKIRQDQSVLEALAMLQPLSRYAPASAALADVRTAVQAIRAIVSEADQRASDVPDEAAPAPHSTPASAGKSRAA